MFAGEECSWGLYHLVAISTRLDKADKALTAQGADDTLTVYSTFCESQTITYISGCAC